MRTLVEEFEVGALAFSLYDREHSPSTCASVELAVGSRGQLHILRRMTAFTPLYHKVLLYDLKRTYCSTLTTQAYLKK